VRQNAPRVKGLLRSGSAKGATSPFVGPSPWPRIHSEAGAPPPRHALSSGPLLEPAYIGRLRSCKPSFGSCSSERTLLFDHGPDMSREKGAALPVGLSSSPQQNPSSYGAPPVRMIPARIALSRLPTSMRYRIPRARKERSPSRPKRLSLTQPYRSRQ